MNVSLLPPFSVLMSTYRKDSVFFLREALQSILSQTLLPSDMVIVKDGPLTKELDDELQFFRETVTFPLRILELSTNVGLGLALAEGIKFTAYDLVARMDADDIAKPERFMRQISFLAENLDVDVLSCWVDEFIDQTDIVSRIKKIPETHNEIKSYMQKRNPINHPATVFKKSTILKASNYQDFYLNEDYYLWIRVMSVGAIFYNIQDSLLFFRVNSEMYKRRGGFRYIKQDIKLQLFMYHSKFISLGRMFSNLIIRIPIRLLPNSLRSIIYKYILR